MPNRIRNVYEDEQVKIVVPLDRATFCKLAEGTKWCGLHTEFGPMELVDIVRKGTPYIHINKKDGVKHLFHGNSRIPFHDLNSDEPGNLSIFDSERQRLNSRKFLSTNKGVYKLFNIEYTLKERLKYEIPLTSEELDTYAKTNKFTEAINKVRLNYNEETEEELYKFNNDENRWVINFTDESGQFYTKRYQDSDKTYVTIKPYGIEVSVTTSRIYRFLLSFK